MSGNRRPVSGEPGARDDGGPSPPTGIADGNLAQPIELNDFMQGLGFVFQLPKKRQDAPPTDLAEPSPARTPRTRPMLLLAGLAVTAVAGYFLLQLPPPADPLPPAALGRWVTNDPRYASRGFDLSAESIVFHTGPGQTDLTRHPILGVRVGDKPGTSIVTVDYALDGEPMTFAFAIVSGPVPVIHLLNQPDIAWIRIAGP
jgi:hypothetical protein